MEIYEVLKVMSSENKAKLIARFLNCENCVKKTVGELCGDTGLKQACLSKHLMELRKKGILVDTKDGREVHYRINKNFKNQWGHLIQIIIENNEQMLSESCDCESKK